MTTSRQTNPFFTMVINSFSTSMSKYPKMNTIQLSYIIELFVFSVISCIIGVVCCMCRRENSTDDIYDYTLIPSVDTDMDTHETNSIDSINDEKQEEQEKNQSIYQTSVYSPVNSSSVEPIIQPIIRPISQPRTTRRVLRVHRVHRTPRKPIPRYFAKTIEELEYMV